MPLDLNSQVARVADMMAAPVDQDLVILNLATNTYVGLDGIGRRIWELLETPQSVEALCRHLGQEFDGSPDEIAADVMSFLRELEAEGLLQAT